MEAGKRGRSVLLLDHATKLAEKSVFQAGAGATLPIVIQRRQISFRTTSFLPLGIGALHPAAFYSARGKAWYPLSRKKLDNYFAMAVRSKSSTCFGGRQRSAGKWQMPCRVTNINPPSAGGLSVMLETDVGEFETQSLVIATGGLSIPPNRLKFFGLSHCRAIWDQRNAVARGLGSIDFCARPAGTAFRTSRVALDAEGILQHRAVSRKSTRYTPRVEWSRDIANFQLLETRASCPY